jgi:hypothetical protein
VRTGDGIHFTPAGGDRLADAVFRLLDDRCRVEVQAVPGATQPVTKTPGSSRVPGTHREPTSETTPTTGEPVTTTTAPATTTTAKTDPPVTAPSLP